eukprot:502679-Alexandrium_andersonii.AAC.1
MGLSGEGVPREACSFKRGLLLAFTGEPETIWETLQRIPALEGGGDASGRPPTSLPLMCGGSRSSTTALG